MGAACARQLAERGDRLVLLARSPEVEELAAGIGALAVRGSVDDPDALRRLVETALTRHGRIDAVVANTGHAAKGDLLELTDREWHEGFDLLLMLAIRLSRLAVPLPMAMRFTPCFSTSLARVCREPSQSRLGSCG